MFAQRLLLLCRYAIWLKNAQIFFYILNTLPNRKLSIRGRESCYSRPRVVLPSAASSATFGRESTTCQAFQEALSLCKERCDTHDGVSHLSFFYKSFRVGAKLTSQTCACAVRWTLPPEGGRHRGAGRQSAVWRSVRCQKRCGAGGPNRRGRKPRAKCRLPVGLPP